MESLPLARLKRSFATAFLKTEPPDQMNLGLAYLERAYQVGLDARDEPPPSTDPPSAVRSLNPRAKRRPKPNSTRQAQSLKDKG